MQLTLAHFLVVSVLLLVAGIVTMVVKRNAIGILMGDELILNAGALNLVAFNTLASPTAAGTPPHLDGQVFTLFVIVMAAAEAAVALAIFLNFYNNFSSIDVEKGTSLKG
jgi:NADH:ubiquinone oxidoreductase subunit K